MDGEPWTELLKAFKKFIESRIRINNDNEIISIIVFDETAKIIIDRRNIKLYNESELCKV